MSLLDAFPAEWRCDLTIKRSGGRDGNGDPAPATEHTLFGCVVGPRATREPVDRSDLTDTTAVAYADPAADIRSTDSVVVPAGHFMAGTYVVDGQPGFWPLGTEIPLRRS